MAVRAQRYPCDLSSGPSQSFTITILASPPLLAVKKACNTLMTSFEGVRWRSRGGIEMPKPNDT